MTIDGVAVFAGSAVEAGTHCRAQIRQREGARIATVNLDFLALARRNPQLKEDLIRSTMVIADGMPVVWLAKIAGATAIGRLAGADLVRELFATSSAPPLRVAIFGSTPEISSRAVQTLHAEGDGARVVHISNPPFRKLTDEEQLSELDRLRNAEPDVVLVALGCPAQERLIAEWSPELPSVAWIGIGGTLDFYGGVRKRAPRALQRAGMEWTVRLAQDPRRLARRYFLRDLPALFALAPKCLASRLIASKRFD